MFDRDLKTEKNEVYPNPDKNIGYLNRYAVSGIFLQI